jgi:hypothetical protein
MAAGASGDGFVTYDQLEGPDLDPARWTPVRLPLPTSGEHLPLDPSAEVTVGRGEVQVRIPRFRLAHDTSQAADSAKYPGPTAPSSPTGSASASGSGSCSRSAAATAAPWKARV